MKTINRNDNDLHPEDYLNRLRLRDWLKAEMQRQGVGTRELAARVGHNSSWAHGVMQTVKWRGYNIQKMVRALGYRLIFEVDIDVEPAPTFLPSFSAMYANHPDLTQLDEAVRLDLGVLAGRLREALKLTPAAVGRRLRCEGGTVRAFEGGDRPQWLLVTAQRHIRALGGTLRLLILDPGTGEVFEAPKDTWPSTGTTDVNVVQSGDRVLVWNAKTPETVASFGV